MDYQRIAKNLTGFQTIFTIVKTLKIIPKTAVNYIYELRKRGYLHKTIYGRNKIRTYYIQPVKKVKMGHPDSYEIINKYSRIKVVPRYHYISHNKISVEEALVKTIRSEDFRTILCALELFNHINWPKLYKLAKEDGLARNVGALYDLTRKIIKVKKMDERTRISMLKSNGKKFTIKNFKSKDFHDIEKEWRVFLPFNKGDLLAYKEWS